jgi:hypothetical protein
MRTIGAALVKPLRFKQRSIFESGTTWISIRFAVAALPLRTTVLLVEKFVIPVCDLIQLLTAERRASPSDFAFFVFAELLLFSRVKTLIVTLDDSSMSSLAAAKRARARVDKLFDPAEKVMVVALTVAAFAGTALTEIKSAPNKTPEMNRQIAAVERFGVIAKS